MACRALPQAAIPVRRASSEGERHIQPDVICAWVRGKESLPRHIGQLCRKKKRHIGMAGAEGDDRWIGAQSQHPRMAEDRTFAIRSAYLGVIWLIDMIRVGRTRNLLRDSSSLSEIWPRSGEGAGPYLVMEPTGARRRILRGVRKGQREKKSAAGNRLWIGRGCCRDAEPGWGSRLGIWSHGNRRITHRQRCRDVWCAACPPGPWSISGHARSFRSPCRAHSGCACRCQKQDPTRQTSCGPAPCSRPFVFSPAQMVAAPSVRLARTASCGGLPIQIVSVAVRPRSR